MTIEVIPFKASLSNLFANEDLGASATYVGEYSCTLSPQTWSKVAAEVRPELTMLFGDVQSERWHFKACGSAFWTIKMDWMPGGDWGFKEQVDNGAIKAPAGLYLSAEEVSERSKNAEEKRSKFMMDAVQSHTSYWDEQATGVRFEHWRFADGVSRFATLQQPLLTVYSGIWAGQMLEISSLPGQKAYFLVVTTANMASLSAQAFTMEPQKATLFQR